MLFREVNTEIIASQRAAYDVLRNRMLAQNKDACTIVKQPHQFAFVKDHHIKVWKATKYEMNLLKRVKRFPKVLDERYKWFFHKSIRPRWAKKMKCRLIGTQYYCRKAVKK